MTTANLGLLTRVASRSNLDTFREGHFEHGAKLASCMTDSSVDCSTSTNGFENFRIDDHNSFTDIVARELHGDKEQYQQSRQIQYSKHSERTICSMLDNSPSCNRRRYLSAPSLAS